MPPSKPGKIQVPPVYRPDSKRASIQPRMATAGPGILVAPPAMPSSTLPQLPSVFRPGQINALQLKSAAPPAMARGPGRHQIVQRAAASSTAAAAATSSSSISQVRVLEMDDTRTGNPSLGPQADKRAADNGVRSEPVASAKFSTSTIYKAIYIFGHGGYADGGQMKLDAATLAQTLYNNGLRAVAEIHLMGCHSGTGYSMQVQVELKKLYVQLKTIIAAATSSRVLTVAGITQAVTPAAQQEYDLAAFCPLTPPQARADILHRGAVPLATSGAQTTTRTSDEFDPLSPFYTGSLKL